MASVQLKNSYGDKSDSEVFEAAKQAIVNAGYEVWKTRELAKLVLGTGTEDGQEVRLNVVVSMVDASATISAESDDLDEAVLNGVTQKVDAELQKLLA
ncbi:MAG: hypothetical protein FJZ98_01075 [Chloroflexi bacterium]|nr:hypothetical protein [Chloroflexota bacterium]